MPPNPMHRVQVENFVDVSACGRSCLGVGFDGGVLGNVHLFPCNGF